MNKKLAKVSKEVTEWCADDKGKRVDPGIVDVVIGLRANGVQTVSSCEGHLDWGIGEPYVRFAGKSHDKFSRQLGLQHLSETPDWKGAAHMANELERDLKVERKKVKPLVVSFNNGRPSDHRVKIQDCATGSDEIVAIVPDGANLNPEEILQKKTGCYAAVRTVLDQKGFW